MVDRRSILERLTGARGEVADIARDWLTDENTLPLTEAPVELTVFEAMHLWRVRLRSSSEKGIKLIGAESLISELDGLAHQKRLEQIGFLSHELTGNLFFEYSNGKFVGGVLVKRSPVVHPQKESALAK